MDKPPHLRLAGPEDEPTPSAWPPFLAQWVVPYLKEPSLWPVAMALLGHVVVVLAPLMLMVKRSGSWWAGAGLCVAAAVSAWAVRCEWLDDGGPRSVAVATACVWLLSVAAAWYGGNAGYL